MGPKASPLPTTSGFGIELTMKVQVLPGEAVDGNLLALKAPLWPVELLSRLVAHVQRTSKRYDHDHWIEAGARGFGPENVRALDPNLVTARQHPA